MKRYHEFAETKMEPTFDGGFKLEYVQTTDGKRSAVHCGENNDACRFSPDIMPGAIQIFGSSGGTISMIGWRSVADRDTNTSKRTTTIPLHYRPVLSSYGTVYNDVEGWQKNSSWAEVSLHFHFRT